MTVVINGTTGIDTGTGSLIAADSTTATYLDMFEDTDNGSNYVRLIAPASIASNKTITLPDATGTAVVGSAAVSAVGQIPFSTDGSTYTPTAKIVSAAAVSASGTSVDFTSIPSWVKRITVMFSGMSTNGTSLPQIQIGSGSFVTSGYISAVTNIQVSTAYSAFPTTGFGLFIAGNYSATTPLTGVIVLTNISGNTWLCSGTVCRTDTATTAGTATGSLSLSGTRDRVRITTVNGTDAFDAGTINILYE